MSGADPPAPDITECARFLRLWMQVTEVPHVTLVAILPDTQVVHARTFRRGDEDAACAWVSDHQASGRNVYFQPNETQPDCSKKPRKSDMVAAHCRFADVDPDDAHAPWAEERGRLHRLAEALRDSASQPTAIIDSGNGIQPLWAVAREALTPEVTARVEAETAALERALGGGGTHNVDRLLRLPGTLNFPNQVKRDRGRGVTRARLIFAGSAFYQPDQVGGLVDGHHLADAGVVRPRRGGSNSAGHTADPVEITKLVRELEQAGAAKIGTVKDLGHELQARLAAAMLLDPVTMTDRDYARRKRLADRWAGLIDDLTEAGRDDSHSGADMSLAAMLKAAGFGHLETAKILLAFRHGKANNDEWPVQVYRLRHVARAAFRSHGEASDVRSDALPDTIAAALSGNPLLAERWNGNTEGLTDTSPAGLDADVLRLLKAIGFTRDDAHVALLRFQHGRLTSEADAHAQERYFEALWRRIVPTPVEGDDGSDDDDGGEDEVGDQQEDDSEEESEEEKQQQTPPPFRAGWQGPPDPELALPFVTSKKGKVLAKHQNNIRKAIDGCGVTLSYDEFADRELIEGPDNRPRRFYGDAEENALYLQIDRKYGFLPSLSFFQLVTNEFARRHAFHPVRQYLDHVQPYWDSVKRVGDPDTPSWLSTYGGAKDNSHTRAVGRMVLVAAVRRVRQPGAKFDEILTLVTPKQGQNRSTAIEIMAVNEEWFTDSLPIGADDKIVIEQTSGIWIGELADLHGKRGDVNKLKAFASRKRDRARLAYGHRREERPRQFVLIATTNEDRPLTDVTGNRRYLIVRIIGFDIDALARDRDQLWAEAATIEASGESIRLDAKLHEAAALQQEAHRARDAWEELLGDLLEDKTGKIQTEEVWAAVGKEDPGKRFQDDNLRISNVMRALGWRSSRRRFGENKAQPTTGEANQSPRRYCYVKGTTEEVNKITITFPRKAPDPRKGSGRP